MDIHNYRTYFVQNHRALLRDATTTQTNNQPNAASLGDTNNERPIAPHRTPRAALACTAMETHIILAHSHITTPRRAAPRPAPPTVPKSGLGLPVYLLAKAMPLSMDDLSSGMSFVSHSFSYSVMSRTGSTSSAPLGPSFTLVAKKGSSETEEGT